MKSSFKKAFFDTLPVLAGFIVLGIAYGMLFVEKVINGITQFL